MKKGVLVIAALMMSIASFSQVYKSTEGKVHFFSEATLENIEATNNNAKGAVRASDSTIIILITNLAFKFEKPLMEEHFHENYMETEKYPKTKFSGKVISGMDFTQDGTYEVTVSGKLDLHGEIQEREITGTIIKKKNELTLHAVFMIKMEDHKVKVPSMYIDNIAEEVQVTADFKMEIKK